ncbi:SPOR domain-containing protein [Magnetococcus sp. PR-3]|uniref:SPOR domain-containing protein n=1 Tax=Magnetococcus sp. PR-3 TaxID=3120355 RepID=UPI002FCE1676
MNIGTHIVDDLYTIRDMLDQGPLGLTFLATDRLTDAPMVIKPIPAELTRDQSALVWFQQRYQRLKSLKHPVLHTKYNHAYDQASASQFITAPYVPGEHLGLWLKRQKDGRVDPGKALSMLKRVAEALDMAHNAGLPHLSLKLENIIITPDESVILTDHALSYARQLPAWRRLGKDLQPATLISCYTAPEIIQTLWLDQLPSHDVLRQANEDLKADMPGVAADIFALGGVLFTMLTGQAPFTTEDYLEALVHGELPSLHVDAQLPLAIHAHLARALERSPAERYASTIELVEVLTGSWKQWERQSAEEKQTDVTQASATPAVMELSDVTASNDSTLDLAIIDPNEENLLVDAEDDLIISSPEENLQEDHREEELPILDLASIEAKRLEGEPEVISTHDASSEEAIESQEPLPVEISVSEDYQDETTATVATDLEVEAHLLEETVPEEATPEEATPEHNESDLETMDNDEDGTLPVEMHEEALLELQHEDLLDDPDGHSQKMAATHMEDEAVEEQTVQQPVEAILVDTSMDEPAQHDELCVERTDHISDQADALESDDHSYAATSLAHALQEEKAFHDEEQGRAYETIGRPLDHVDENNDPMAQVTPKKRRSSPLLRAAAVVGIVMGAGMSWFLFTQAPDSPFQTVELQPAQPFVLEQEAPINTVPEIKAPEDLTLVSPAPETLRKNPAERTRAVLDQLDNDAAMGMLRQQLAEVAQKHDQATAALGSKQGKMQKLEQDLKQTQTELVSTRQELRNTKRELAEYANSRLKIASLEERVRMLVKQRDSVTKLETTEKTKPVTVAKTVAKTVDKTQNAKRVSRLEQRLQANKERYRSTQLRADEMLLKPNAGEIIPHRASPQTAFQKATASHDLITATAPPAPRSDEMIAEDEQSFTTTKGGLIFVQVASHMKASVAQAQRNILAKRKIEGRTWPVVTQKARVNGRLYHRVRFGPLASAQEATELTEALAQDLKLDGIMVRKRSHPNEITTTKMLAKHVPPVRDTVATAKQHRSYTGKQRRGYSVQVAAFSSSDAAEDMEMKIQTMDWPTQDIPVFREAKMVDGRLFHRVRIGPFKYKNQAARMNAMVHEMTSLASIVVNHRIATAQHVQATPKKSRKIASTKYKRSTTRRVSKKRQTTPIANHRVDSGYMVQLGAFTSKNAVNSAKRKLAALREAEGNLPMVQETTTLAGQDLIRLKLGPYSSKTEAQQMQAMVKEKAGISGGTIVDHGEW